MTDTIRPETTILTALASGDTGRLLTEELIRRWPHTVDRLTGMTRYALLPTGKLIRPLLLLLSAEAVGGLPDGMVRAALSVEYLHAATLVHDDIIDGDLIRRGRPSVPAAFGTDGAVLCGDHLIFTAFGELAAAAGAKVAAVVAALSAAGVDLCRGQTLESELAGDPAVSIEAYLQVVRLKTGALFRAAGQIGALLAGGSDPQVASLAAYGEHLGIAFQMRDDLLAYRMSEVDAGKPATSDLSNARPTLPVLMAYQHGTPELRAELTERLRPGAYRPGTLDDVHRLLAAAGAFDFARDQLHHYVDLAEAQLSTVADSDSVSRLIAVARWAKSEER